MARNTETHDRLHRLTKQLGDLPTAAITWFFSDTASLYNVLGTQPGVGNYLNLGWWDRTISKTDSIDEETITEACGELVRQFGSFGDLEADEKLLDVGFGFGQQDVRLVQEFGCRDITGINITPRHVHEGRKLIEERNLADRVSLQLGDAVKIPFADETFDTVFALESAFHFRTRKDFFHEASRVLKPGGKLLTADIIGGPKRSRSSSLQSFLARAHEAYWNIPSENRTNSEGYRRTLQDHGFKDVVLRDVSDRVLEPWVENYLTWRINQQSIPLRWMGRPILNTLIRFYQSDFFSYVFVKARRPDQGP